MKKTLGKIIAGLLILASGLSSCTKPENDVLKMIPETATAVVTFHPGQIMEKGKIQQINFLQEELSQHELAKKIFTNPETSGIKMDAYSTVFYLVRSSQIACAVMPMASKSDFEVFLEEMEKETGQEIAKGNILGYKTLEESDVVLLYNSSYVFIVSEIDGWSQKDVKEVAEYIVGLDKDNALITDTDFKNFIGKQKDINLWISSNNLEQLSGMGEGMDMFGGIKNNYGHVFADFQNGFMTLKTNLRFNANWQETIEQYNFMDEKAIKDLLDYIPSKNLVFAGNTNIDQEKVFGLLKFVNNDFDRRLDEISRELGVEKEEITRLFSGEVAFSFNGIKTSVESENIEMTGGIPTFVFASRIKSESGFDGFIQKASEWASITETDGYYKFSKGIPVYMIREKKDMVISNNQEIIAEISKAGKVKENVTVAPYSDILVSNPVCFFLNLDRESYTDQMREIIEDKFPHKIPGEVEKIGQKMKSVTFSANIEEWELRVDVKDESENILYSILSQLDK